MKVFHEVSGLLTYDNPLLLSDSTLRHQQIVQDEQDANFISRLHSGRLNIVPWPIIESKSFYNLFFALRKRLDQQVLTHPAAGEFLLTLKTLMAKLKVSINCHPSQFSDVHFVHLGK